MIEITSIESNKLKEENNAIIEDSEMDIYRYRKLMGPAVATELLNPYILENSLNFTDVDLKPKIDIRYAQTQRWLGHVEEINDYSFNAILIDLTNGGTNEHAEFNISEVSLDDRHLLTVGAAFYWNIGLAFENGTAVHKSFIRFQRVKSFGEAEKDKALDLVSSWSKLF